MQVQSLGGEDALEKEMANHSSIFAWEIQWTEEPGRLQSMGSQRVEHNITHLVSKQQQWLSIDQTLLILEASSWERPIPTLPLSVSIKAPCIFCTSPVQLVRMCFVCLLFKLSVSSVDCELVEGRISLGQDSVPRADHGVWNIIISTCFKNNWMNKHKEERWASIQTLQGPVYIHMCVFSVIVTMGCYSRIL